MKAVELLELPDDQVHPLLAASEAEGFRFVRRVVTEWEAGANRFEGRGEALLGCFQEGRLVGLCGLMRDPYQSGASVGRVRNLYVLPAFRGRGIGAMLTREAIERARKTFRVLRLRAATPEAAALYERLGFAPTGDLEDCTHVLYLRPRTAGEAGMAERSGGGAG
jgi:ribosomal protein S18 acetylase RimI-like enzyme